MTASITINTNLASLTCQKYLSDATKGMNTAMERLSTGFRINSAKDDAAGYAVSAGMEAKVNGYDIIETNAQMGLDMLTTQEGVLDIINDYLQRIRDLTMQAANGTYGSASLDAIRTEVIQRMDEINRLCTITDFNDTYLLDGSRTEDINLQVGLYSNKRCVITMDKFLFASAKSTVIMGFASAKNADGTDNLNGYIDLRASDTLDETNGFIYRARQIDENGQLDVVMTDRNSGDMVVAMNIVGGSVLTFNAVAEGRTLTITPFTRRLVIPVEDDSAIGGTALPEAAVTVSGYAERYTDALLFWIEYTGTYTVDGVEYEIVDSDISCWAKEN